MRTLFTILLLLLPISTYAYANKLDALPQIDKVLVVKSERTLHLQHRGETVKTYRVSLGKQTGPKLYEGDQRTPEGMYWINWRRHSNNFNLSMHISYQIGRAHV